jgi:hypothetical protein
MPLWRSYCEVTYVTCMRCERKVPIEDCIWQAGLLICKMYDCQDRNVNGAFEMEEVRQVSQDRQELVPDPKLINPSNPQDDINHISASAGEY